MEVIIIYSVTETKVGKWGVSLPSPKVLDTLPVGKKKRGIEGYWVNHAQASKQNVCYVMISLSLNV